MVSPYREAREAYAEVEAEPNKPLAELTVSGPAGQKGRNGAALIQLAGRLMFLAESQIGWLARLPPFRWTRRAPAVAAFVREHVERFITLAFGAHNLDTARGKLRAIGKALRVEHQRDSRGAYKMKRRAWALERFRAPLAAMHITSDVEVLTTSAERVLAEDEYMHIAATKSEHGQRRRELTSAASQAHRELLHRSTDA